MFLRPSINQRTVMKKPFTFASKQQQIFNTPQKFYVAFSIHGTNQFITASVFTHDFTMREENGVKKVTVKGMVFTEARSRRFDYKKENGLKLHHDRLKTKEGKPSRSPPMVVKFFNELEAQGWVVVKEAFIQKHWKR